VPYCLTNAWAIDHCKGDSCSGCVQIPLQGRGKELYCLANAWAVDHCKRDSVAACRAHCRAGARSYRPTAWRMHGQSITASAIPCAEHTRQRELAWGEVQHCLTVGGIACSQRLERSTCSRSIAVKRLKRHSVPSQKSKVPVRTRITSCIQQA
jgi:hypothetical protein